MILLIMFVRLCFWIIWRKIWFHAFNGKSYCSSCVCSPFIISASFTAGLQGGSSPCRRALEVTTATAWRCTPWRTVPRLSTITCSAGWVRGATSAPPAVAAVAGRGTGVSVNKPSRTGSGDRTGTAPKARKGTFQMWPRGPPSQRWRCGNRRGELWLRSSSLPLPILTTAGRDIAPTPVPSLWGYF